MAENTKLAEHSLFQDREVLEGYSPITFKVAADDLLALGMQLKEDPSLYFDQLSNLSAIDLGADSPALALHYQFYSVPFGHQLGLWVELEKSKPEVPSLVALWATANWAEREAYDMMGIVFTAHPDLRRILLPANWEGFPLRKDYQEQEYYHGIKVKY